MLAASMHSISQKFASLTTVALPFASLVAAEPSVTPGASAIPAATPTVALNEVVITATRTEQSPINVPNTVRAISEKDLQERQVRTLPEALRETPGVSVQKTSNGQGSPFIRGFTGFRNLALIDGVRFNNSTFREGPNQYWSTIDPLALDHIELVPGQGSVLYGSDAIGGTLNVFTKDSGFRDAPAGATFFKGSAEYRFSSGERSHGEHLEINAGQGGSWGLHVGGSLRQFGDVEAAGLGRQEKTGYDEWAYDIRFDAALNEHWSLTAAHQQLRQDDVWRTHSTIYGLAWEGTKVGSDLQRSFDQERTLSYVRLAGEDLGAIVNSASLTLSHQSADETQYRIRSSRARDISDINLDTFGADLQLSSKTPIGLLTYGVDYYRDNVDSSGSSYNANGSLKERAIQGPVGDDSTYDLFGAYLQDQINVTDSLHLFLGGRYTHAKADVGKFKDPISQEAASFSDDWNNAVGSARFVVDLDAKDQYSVFGGVSQGFRAPNLSDLSRLDIARSGELEVASTDLDPEKFLNFEMGLKARTESFTGSVSYFHTRIDDLIVRQPTGRKIEDGDKFLTEVSKSNAGEGYVHGVELAGSYAFDKNWSIFGHVSWTEGEADQYPGKTSKTSREPLSRIVPVMGLGGIRWQSNDQRIWVEAICQAASKADQLNTADRADTERIPPGGTPGYALVTLRGGVQINECVGLTVALENLLDQEYRAHGSGSNEPGFGVTASLKVKF